MSRLDEYFAKVNRGSQTTSSVSASGEKPASNMDAYFAKAGKPVRTNPLNLYTEALKASQGQSTMQTPYADAAAQTKQSGTQNLYAQAAENAKKSGNAAKGTSVVFNSVYGKADDRASSAGSGKYAGILKASDYTELSKGAESKRKLFGDARYDYINNIGNFRAQSDVQQAQGRGQDYGKYAFMTDDEIGVYNYLYATQGKKAANAFLSDLEPELDKQWYTGTNRATTEALGKNAATRTLASAMTVAAQPARTITSMIAMADDAVRTAKGQEINPYSKWRQASNITQELRADTSQHIEEANPGMGGKVGSFVYNTAMSAADSAMNALVAKGIGEAVGLTGDTLMKATNILGSALMSSEAASLSIAESKEKGYSNAGALALGLTRGAIEYASEAVGGEWVIRKIKANPLSFVKSMALTMIPEGMEEVMSDAANGVVNLAIDAAFGTEESGIPRMLEYYRTSGTDWQKKHAELATVLAVLGQEGLSFLGGALATLGSSSVQYSTNRANINQTAERLDTTPKNVVQMMQDAQTENPGVIYALAELTDAENADDLRQKIGTKEDMKRAAEYLTQQMEAGGRFGAQEGTYTAGAQNAPVGAQRAQNEGNSTTPAAAINIQEGMNNGQSTYQGRENGSYDLRTGGQAAAEGGTQDLAGGRAEIPGGVGADAQADLRQVTPAQLGIRNGGTEAVTVVDVRKLGGDAARAYNLLAANNIEPVAVRGAIQVNNGYANAYTESGRVFFRVDAVDSRGNAISPEALVRHELFHNYISEEVLQTSDEVIRESMTAEEYDAMYESYRDAYASIYDFENMSVDEIERLLTEEIAADAYAGLNWFSGDAPVQEAVRAETERSAPAQRAEAQQETTGPPGRATAAGIGARTADSAALRRAEALEKSGTDNETIRQETGWYRGMDGQWRFEIDDSGAAFSRSGEAQYSADNADYAHYTQLMNRMLTGELTEAEHAELLGLDKKNGSTKKELARRIDEGNATLRDIMQHNALFEAYPEIAETKVKFADMPSGTAGSYNRETNTITLDAKLKYDANEALDALMHEVQHRVQAAEGFASGTNPGYWNRGENYDRAAEKYRDNRARLLNGLSTEDLALYNEYRSAEREMGAMLDGSMLYDESRMDALEKRSDELYKELYGKEWFGKLNRYDRILGDAGEAVKEFYRSTAGEIEARDTTSRRRMTAEERKNTPPELGDVDTVFADFDSVKYMSAEDAAYDAETAGIKEQLIQSQEKLNKMEVVSKKTVPENLRSKPQAAEWAINELKGKPDYVDRKGVGQVDVSQKAIRNAVKYADTPAEKAALVAAPDVIKRGIEIGGHDNHKSRGKSTMTIAAPVELNGQRGNMAVVINLRGNKYYAHRILTPDGAVFKFEHGKELKIDTGRESQRGVTVSGSLANATSSVSNNTIRSTAGNSQEKSSGKASVEVNPDDTATQRLKERQFELIQNNHPKEDWDYQTWINSVDDVKTYQEAVDDDRAGTPDFDDADIDRALKTGRVRVYSSHRIRIGTFVTPSRMEAENYAGSENVYSKTVPLTDVAWIDSLQGQFAPTSDGRASVEVENRDSDNKKQGRKKLSEAEKYQNTTPKMAENRTVRNVAEYEKQISGMEKRLETGGQATLNEGGGNFYRVNIREENGEYYAYISDGKNVVAKHKSKAKMEAIRWAGDRMRAEIASRILYNPDTKLRGSYQSDLKRAENREYPVFKTESGTEVQTVPFWTWVQDKSGHYGLVVGQDINGAVRAWFPFGGDGTGTVVTAANTTLYAVEGDYESRAWNNEIAAEALDDAEESAAARNARKDKMRESQENDRREAERLRARENLGAGQRFVPNKSSGEVYRELMGKGKSEVKVQMTGFLKGTPRDSTFKIEVKPTPIGGYFEATIFHDGHKADTLVRALKETAARDAAEEVITMANKNFSEENYQRAKKFEAEKTADEDARIAELFGDPEQLDSTEPSPKSSDAAETENTAAGTTIAATTEKVTSEVIKAERNFREDFEKITSGAMRMFVNAGDTVRRIAKATGSKSLEGYYFNAGAYSQRAGNWIAKGGARTDIDGHRIGASLADTLAPMRKNKTKYRDFQLYLLHMHNVDRMKYDNSGELERIKENLRWVKEKYPELRELSNEELRRIANSDSDSPVVRQAAHEIYLAAHNGEAPSLTSVAEGAAYALELERQRAIVEKQGLKPVFGYDVTADDSQTAAQLLEAKNPEFKEWAKEVYKYSDDLIRYRVEAGLITPEFANALKKRYPHYIPTFREEGTNSKRARSARRNGGIVVSNAIGRAVGSDGVLLPLHTALSRKTVSTMRNAGLNQFGLALVREYDGNTKAAEKYIWNVAESEYTPTEAAIESDEDYKPVFENVFSVKDNGKIYDITMDEGLTAAMKAFEPDRFASYGAAKAMKKLNDLFKALCTGYNPFFMVRNLARDMQDAAFYSTDSATWAKMFPSAWKQIVTNGEIWQQYKALGGSYASMLDYTTGMVKEPKSAAGKLAAKYESLGQAIEAAPRLAEFMTILANKGGSKTVDGVKTGKFTQSDLMEAMLGAADITTNFASGGSVTKALNRYLVPFLNPSVQGFDKFIRNATETRSVKAAGSLILKAALMGIAPALLNALAYRDDDEWDDIPANTKANYYLINAGKWLGDGYWIKIPKGRAIAVLSTAAVYGKEKIDGEDVKFSDVFEVIKSNIAPTDIFNQNIATAWTQAKLTNPDNPGTTWYGGNIESDRLQNYRPEDRYDEKTDELSKAIGKLFKVSPKKVNYLLDQYTGVIGDLLLPLITPATKSSHWLLAAPQAAFTIDTTSTNKTTGEYYDLLDDLKYDANDGDIGAGITRKYVSHAGDEVNDYYQQIRAIQNDENLTKAEKNRLVRALKAQLIERQKEIIAQAEPYREAVSDYLKAHPELSTDNDAAIAEYAEQYEITEDQAENRMDAIVYREANREVFGAEYALRTYNADVYDKARTAYAKGVSYETYYDYYFATKEMHADKDENGKTISGSKKAKVVEFINSLDIPPEQKDALYVAAGYTAKSARNQKWNGGSGGSGGRRGRGKRTALKAPTPKAPEIIIPRSGTASSAKAGGTSKTPKVSGNVIADFTKTASGTDIQKAVTQAKRKAIKAGNRTVYVEEGSPIDYFLKYGKLPSLK